MKLELTEGVLLALELVRQTVWRVFNRHGESVRLGFLNIEDKYEKASAENSPLRTLLIEGKVTGVTRRFSHDEVRAEVHIWRDRENLSEIDCLVGKVVCNGWEYTAGGDLKNGEFRVQVKLDPGSLEEIDMSEELRWLNEENPQKFTLMPLVSPVKFKQLYSDIMSLLRSHGVVAELSQQGVGGLKLGPTGDHLTHHLEMSLYCNEPMADPNWKPKEPPKPRQGLTGK